MKKSTSLLLLGGVLALGGIFEWVKSVRKDQLVSDLPHLQTEEFKQDSPYHRSQDEMEAARRLGQQARINGFKKNFQGKGQSAPKKLEEFTFGAPKAKANAAKKDPKKIAEQKKKKPKAKTKAKTNQAPPTIVRTQEFPTRDKDEIPAVAVAPTPLAEEPTPEKEPEEEALTLEDWLALVADQVNPEATRRLIDGFLRGKVDGKVFYQVLDAMLASPQDDVRKQAVLAAGATPSLESYFILIKITESEVGDSEIKQLAEASLASTYREMKNLEILRLVMASSESSRTALLLATDLFLQSFNAVIKNRSEASNETQSVDPRKRRQAQWDNRPSDLSRLLSRYEPFVGVLTGLSSSDDAQVALRARDALDAISSYFEG